jgi:hypothetical protein
MGLFCGMDYSSKFNYGAVQESIQFTGTDSQAGSSSPTPAEPAKISSLAATGIATFSRPSPAAQQRS